MNVCIGLFSAVLMDPVNSEDFHSFEISSRPSRVCNHTVFAENTDNPVGGNKGFMPIFAYLLLLLNLSNFFK